MSGVSFNGGASRCGYNWQKFIDCYTSNSTKDPLQECKAAAEDYHECLHHTKEIQRANRIAAEIAKKEAKGKDLPSVETRRGLKYTLTDIKAIE